MSGAVGMAVTSVVLSALMSDLGPDGAGGPLRAVHRLGTEGIAEPLADAFQHTYLFATGVLALALIPALLLPRRPAE